MSLDSRSGEVGYIVAPHMNVVVAAVAALVAAWFAVRLYVAHRDRHRLHLLVWSVAMAMFATATAALAGGLQFGWSPAIFRLFYLLGAIVNIPLLAAGSVALVLGESAGRRFTAGVIGFTVAGALAVVTAPLAGSLAGVEVPEGSELFDFTVAVGGFSVPGPRVFAVIAGAVGTTIVVVLAGLSAVRWWRAERRRSVANLFIVGGMLGPALGGSLTALGEGGGLAMSLLVGAVLLYTGFVMASG